MPVGMKYCMKELPGGNETRMKNSLDGMKEYLQRLGMKQVP